MGKLVLKLYVHDFILDFLISLLVSPFIIVVGCMCFLPLCLLHAIKQVFRFDMVKRGQLFGLGPVLFSWTAIFISAASRVQHKILTLYLVL